MKMVVITPERIFAREAQALNMLFRTGMERLHLRKPYAGEGELRILLAGIEPVYRNKIVMHDFFGLVREFGLAGVHLNRRNPKSPDFPVQHVSCSCHSIEEVAKAEEKYNYVFLSPIFDSISKSEYPKAFTEQELREAAEKGIINERVFALGGVNINNIQVAAGMGFGGVAVLGELWKDFLMYGDMEVLTEKFLELFRIKERT